MSDNQWIALIARVAPFSYLSEDELDEIADSFTWFTALGGRMLINQGDPSDALYIVVSGALGVYVRTASGEERFVGRIGPGEVVGEMGLISGEPRSATVRCLRDAECLAIAKREWDDFVARHPGALLAITKTLIERLRAAQSDRGPKRFDRALAVIPHDQTIDIDGFARKLTTALGTLRRVVCITRDSASDYSLDWFRSIEAEHDVVVYVAEAGPTPWTQLCLRQADSLLLVARGGSKVGAFDALRFDDTPEAIRPMDLVLLWEKNATISGTADWLALHAFKMHHHIRGDADIERVGRLMNGRGIGLVLAGGGARGVAHYGVIWALRDHGVPIDAVGGTSIGSIVAGMVAGEWSREKMLHCYRDTFSGRSPLTDFTIPTVALLAGRRLGQWLEKWFGGTAIEDLPLSFFCLSTNLTAGGPAVHDRGPLATWMRASIAIPGVLPPLIDKGNIYVDGGVINNMPVDIMRATGRGPVIAVDIHSDTPFTATNETKSRAFGLWTAPQGPSIFQLLWRVATINAAATYHAAQFQPDVLLKPDIGSIGLLDWKGLEASMDKGYNYTVARMEEIKTKLMAAPIAAKDWT